jgi:multiple sugar transport system permease protein
MSRFRTEKYLPLFLLLPVVILFLAVTIYPFFYGLFLSLSRYDIIMGQSFRGLGNYLDAFTDPRFLNALKVTFIFVGAAVVIEFLVGLGIALLVNRKFWAKRVFVSLIYIPMIMAPIAVALMWRMLYNADFGPINYFLINLHLVNRHVAWLSETKLALPSLIMVDVWQWTPFMFLILYAGLQSVPVELKGAAQIDGASSWQIFRSITLPFLIPFIILAFLFRIMDAFKIFDAISVLTKGGPGTSTEVVSWLGYLTGFTYFRLGYAAAMAMVLFIIVMVISQILLKRILG